MTKTTRVAALVTLASLATLLYLVPVAVGYAVGAVPLRLMSSGILFEQSAVSLGGYRMILWSPVVVGVAAVVVALRRKPAAIPTVTGIIGATFAGTLLTLGATLGVGMGALLLVGTDIRWIWKLCCLLVGGMIALVGPQLLESRAEDHDLDVRGIKRGILLGGALAGALILLFTPGPMIGKVLAGAGSWGGSLVWVLAL